MIFIISIFCCTFQFLLLNTPFCIELIGFFTIFAFFTLSFALCTKEDVALSRGEDGVAFDALGAEILSRFEEGESLKVPLHKRQYRRQALPFFPSARHHLVVEEAEHN